MKLLELQLQVNALDENQIFVR